ncbi:hypothetical protein K7X08_026301 [Anisodus acutangulus]|uniref:Pentatricopeptide repeat-containing protein n=1 Tax=Anisodus acutangulus TaxID=402998 RepID=A0A9Q1LLJ3_9SOLA|nr:hypothetical protein K7X08_026301 [Anisodus acutangulus]
MYGYYGEFKAMEGVIQEARQKIDNRLLEGVYITAIRAYGKKSKVQEAVDVFDKMDFFNCEPSVHSYNTIMNILVEHAYFKQAHKVYMKMLEKGISPDVYTFTIRIKSFCRTKRPNVALRLLNNMLHQGCLSEKGQLNEAARMLEALRKEGLNADVVTYNTLICGLCKHSKDGYFNRAKSLFNEATGKGMKSNVILYNTLIKGMCQLGLILEALKLMTEMPEKGCRPNTWTYNLIINGLCKMGCVSDASNILNDAVAKVILPDIFTFNTLIDGYCKQTKLVDAIEILNTMWDHDVVPDVITYNTMLDGLCKLKTSDDVMETFKVMVEKGCVPNIITYNILIESLLTFGTLINGFCENEDLDGAYELFRRMKRQYKCSHTTATYNILISAFAKKLKMDMAEKLFLEMNEYGCPPDNYTYRCMIDGFCKVDNTEFGYKFLLDNMTKEFLPSKETVGRVINCLYVKNRLLEAVGIIHLMVQKGVVPDVVHIF